MLPHTMRNKLTPKPQRVQLNKEHGVDRPMKNTQAEKLHNGGSIG